MELFNRLESEVRSYCRGWPSVFTTSRGAELWDEGGRRYLDLFAGAGALNYGHNNPDLKRGLIEYLQSDGITHSLDMASTAKRNFMLAFERWVLKPRGLDYKLQFPGPTGTNSVEAALKLARKVTERHAMVSFTNAFHGMTLGALAVTGNGGKRAGAGVPLGHGVSLPYAGYMEGGTDSLDYFEALLSDTSSGLDKPAAVIVETVQAEGGIKVASERWLRRLRDLTQRHGVLLIVDDIQVGCGRTGPFFSFERAGIEPDIVCLSKSLSGYGLPLSLVLLKPELDQWAPGEHNGTFRGHNPAFVTGAAALERFWQDDSLTKQTQEKAKHVEGWLAQMADLVSTRQTSSRDRIAGQVNIEARGLGLIQGLELAPGDAKRIAAKAFEGGVLIETAGAQDEVMKLLPPLTIERAQLDEALGVVERCIREVCRVERATSHPPQAVADAS